MITTADLLREVKRLNAEATWIAGNASKIPWAMLAQIRSVVPQLAAALEAAGRCTTCDGHPHASGRVCICGGSGRRSEETLNMRQALQVAEARLAKVREREILPVVGNDGRLCGYTCGYCRHTNHGYWDVDQPENHAPDCPARPMEPTP